jgi:hypothetical protein
LPLFAVVGFACIVAAMEASSIHSYYDWQVSTLMLAYDTMEPIARDDSDGQARREQAVQQELFELANAVLPQQYKDDPEVEFPPEVVMLLTRATIIRAAQIMKLTRGDVVVSE